MIPEISKLGHSLPPATHKETETNSEIAAFNTETNQREAACPQTTEAKKAEEPLMDIDLSDEPLSTRDIAAPNSHSRDSIQSQITDCVYGLFKDISLDKNDFADISEGILMEEVNAQTLPEIKEGLETLEQSGAITEGTSLEEWSTIELNEPEKLDTKTPLSLSLNKAIGKAKRFLLRLSEALFGTSTKAIQHALEKGLRSGMFNDNAIEKWKNNYGGNYEQAMAKALETIKAETETTSLGHAKRLLEALSTALKNGDKSALNNALTAAKALHKADSLYAQGDTTFPITLKPTDLSEAGLNGVFGNTAFLITDMLLDIQNTATPLTLHIALEGKEPNSHAFVIKAIQQEGETLLEEGSFL